MKRILLAALGLTLSLTGISSLHADTDSFPIALDNSGTLSWSNRPTANGYAILWAPTVNGPWSTWGALPAFVPTGSVMQVSVPMYYRVVALDYVNTLLIHGDGANNSLDISDTAGHWITSNGGAQSSTKTSKFGSGSIYFNGTNAFLSTPASTDWAFWGGDFTVDFWVNFTAAPGASEVLFIGSHRYNVFTDWSLAYTGGKLSFFIAGYNIANSAWSPTTNNWHHVATTRAGGVVRLFINGNVVATATNNTVIADSYPLTIGATVTPNLFFGGYLDEIRIKKGVTAWTNNFTPPSLPYLP